MRTLKRREIHIKDTDKEKIPHHFYAIVVWWGKENESVRRIVRNAHRIVEYEI